MQNVGECLYNGWLDFSSEKWLSCPCIMHSNTFRFDIFLISLHLFSYCIQILCFFLGNGLLLLDLLIGTNVKHKHCKFLADLACHGDEILVAKGGQG